jgi:NAD(P)-dependent dehydrogenase (short-subunit alcohol dehydrogenase family)
MAQDIFDLSGKVAVVTGAGANGGIGHALAVAFARYGADVAVSDIDDAGAAATAQEIRDLGRAASAAHCDISNPDEVAGLFADVDRAFGRVDILVNVPYAFPSRVRPHDLALDAWNKTLAVCLTGYFLCSQQAIRRMLAQGTGGCILNISSIAGSLGMGRGNFPYSCAKAGVNQMTRELALEYARDGIRVNAIQPAQVLTPGFQKWLDSMDPQTYEKSMGRFLSGIPLGRLLDPQDFAGAAILLCSDAGRSITGVTLPVDGGNLAMNAGGSIVWPSDL